MEKPGSWGTAVGAGGQSWCLRRVGTNADWLLLEDGREVRGAGAAARAGRVRGQEGVVGRLGPRRGRGLWRQQLARRKWE